MHEPHPTRPASRAQRWGRIGWWAAAALAILGAALAAANVVRALQQRPLWPPEPVEDDLTRDARDAADEPDPGLDAPVELDLHLDDPEWRAAETWEPLERDELLDEPAPPGTTEPIWIGDPEPEVVSADVDGIARLRALLEAREADSAPELAADGLDLDSLGSESVAPDPIAARWDDLDHGEDAVLDHEAVLGERASREASALVEDDLADRRRMTPERMARALLHAALVLALGLLLLALQRLERDRSTAIAGALWTAAALLTTPAVFWPRLPWEVPLTASALEIVACGTVVLTALRRRTILAAALAAVWATPLLPWHLTAPMTPWFPVISAIAPWALLVVAFVDRARAPRDASASEAGAGPYRVAAPRPATLDTSWAPRGALRVGAVWLLAALFVRIVRPTSEIAWFPLDPFALAADLALAVAAAIGAGRMPPGPARRGLSIAAALFCAVPAVREIVSQTSSGPIAAVALVSLLFAAALTAVTVALEHLAGGRRLQTWERAIGITAALSLPWVLGPRAPRLGVLWPLLAGVLVLGAWALGSALRRLTTGSAVAPEEADDEHEDDDDDEVA